MMEGFHSTSSSKLNRKEVCESLATFTDGTKELIDKARTLLSQGSVESFVDSQIGCLFQLSLMYGSEYKRLGITKHAELEDFCRRNYSDPQIQDGMIALDEAEVEWHRFLLDIDKELLKANSSQMPVMQAGDLFAFDSSLIDPDTGQHIAVQSLGGGERKDELGSTEIVVISFGAIEGVKRWREDTSCTLRILVDAERRLYNYLGLYRSVLKTWDVEILKTYYAEAIAQGRPLLQPYENIRDDPHQLGGDFIISETGYLLLTHRSRISSDRPSFRALATIINR